MRRAASPRSGPGPVRCARPGVPSPTRTVPDTSSASAMLRRLARSAAFKDCTYTDCYSVCILSSGRELAPDRCWNGPLRQPLWGLEGRHSDRCFTAGTRPLDACLKPARDSCALSAQCPRRSCRHLAGYSNDMRPHSEPAPRPLRLSQVGNREPGRRLESPCVLQRTDLRLQHAEGARPAPGSPSMFGSAERSRRVQSCRAYAAPR